MSDVDRKQLVSIETLESIGDARTNVHVADYGGGEYTRQQIEDARRHFAAGVSGLNAIVFDATHPWEDMTRTVGYGRAVQELRDVAESIDQTRLSTDDLAVDFSLHTTTTFTDQSLKPSYVNIERGEGTPASTAIVSTDDGREHVAEFTIRLSPPTDARTHRDAARVFGELVSDVGAPVDETMVFVRPPASLLSTADPWGHISAHDTDLSPGVFSRLVKALHQNVTESSQF